MVVIVVAIVIVGGFAFGVLAADFCVGVRPSPNRLRVSGARVPGSWFGGFVFRVRLCVRSPCGLGFGLCGDLDAPHIWPVS